MQIHLTPAVLQALATGIDRLGDGDDNDGIAASEARKSLALAGYITENGQCYPVSEATYGYVRGLEELGHYTHVTYNGSWSKAVNPGSTLYLDEKCTVALRTLDGA